MRRMSEMMMQAGSGHGRRRERVDMGAGCAHDSGHRAIGPSGHRAIGPSGHRAIGPSGHRAIGPSGHRAIGVTCARRLAGAHRPAPSTSASSARPESRSGRFPRFFLPAFTLLLGALSLFSAFPVAAQRLITVDIVYDADNDGDHVVKAAPEEGGKALRVRMRFAATSSSRSITLTTRGGATSKEDDGTDYDYELNPRSVTVAANATVAYSELTIIDDTDCEGSEAIFFEAKFGSEAPGDHGTSIKDNEPPCEMELRSDDLEPPTEGEDFAVLLSLNNEVTDSGGATVTLTPKGTASSADYTLGTTSLTIAQYSRVAYVTIPITDDEIIDPGETIGLDAEARIDSSTTLTASLTPREISDNDTATVELTASPTSVDEGSPVTVTATLSKAYEDGVTIPVTVTGDTSETGDHGTLNSITIAAGASSGTGTITTSQDPDDEDEEFTVSLDTGALPEVLTAGSSSSVSITILEPIWSATLNVKQLKAGTGVGCNSNTEGAACRLVLSDDDFTFRGVDYEVVSIQDKRDGFAFQANAANSALTTPEYFRDLNFCVGTQAYAMSGISIYGRTFWRDLYLGWSAGDRVQLGIRVSCATTGNTPPPAQPDPPPQPPAQPPPGGGGGGPGGGGGGGGAPSTATPEVSIAAGPGVTEGDGATFTVTARPAPAAPLTVDVTVTESGSYAATTGTRQVTVPTSGTATLTVATDDDEVDEEDGSVTVTVAAGTGYTVSSTQGTATVAVADNDAPRETKVLGDDEKAQVDKVGKALLGLPE